MIILRSPLFFLTLTMIAGTAYLIYSLGLSKAVLSISYSTVETAVDETIIYLKTKGFNFDEILDGSLFNRWILIAQQFLTSTLPNPVIEMKDMDERAVDQEKEEKKQS